tara:strand:- start:95 stop:376 length:282 start_codon:yes stop_codon:yes gene_type:complete
MTTSANNDPQNNHFLEGLMRSLTNIVNELSRIRRHHREDKNQIIDEMCKQHVETTEQNNKIKEYNQSLFKEVQRMRVAFESLVHHYHQEEQDD